MAGAAKASLAIGALDQLTWSSIQKTTASASIVSSLLLEPPSPGKERKKKAHH